MNPQRMYLLSERLRQLQVKLSSVGLLQQKVKALLLQEEPMKGVRNLDSLITDGRASVGDMKVLPVCVKAGVTFSHFGWQVWVQQAFPKDGTYCPPPVMPMGLQPAPASPRALMAAMLKWYLSLCDTWQALLNQPAPS
jgi:hypothetical protein